MEFIPWVRLDIFTFPRVWCTSENFKESCLTSETISIFNIKNIEFSVYLLYSLPLTDRVHSLFSPLTEYMLHSLPLIEYMLHSLPWQSICCILSLDRVYAAFSPLTENMLYYLPWQRICCILCPDWVYAAFSPLTVYAVFSPLTDSLYCILSLGHRVCCILSPWHPIHWIHSLYKIVYWITKLSPLDREPCCWGGGLPSGGADHLEEAREVGQGGVQWWGARGGGTDLWTEETGGAGCRGKVGVGEGEGLS